MPEPVVPSVAGFYRHLNVPDACLLGKRLYKKQFYEHGQFNAADKKAFVEDIESIEWRYTIKPSTLNIPRYEDENREYLEVAIVQVNLASGRRYQRIAEAMQKAVPYPLLLVLAAGQAGNEQLALNAADKRINRADSNKIVVEALHNTGWIDLAQPAPWQQAFIEDFYTAGFSYSNIHAFYQDMVGRITALLCANYTQRYTRGKTTAHSNSNRLDALQQLDQLYTARSELRNKLAKEKNLGTQVRLNTQVKELMDRIEATKQTLG